MSDQPDTPATPSPSPSPSPSAPMFEDWTGADWFWLAVLVVSLLLGFGMTAFAPI